jgi:hypothetical protein
MYRLPRRSNATSEAAILARVARPPSPENPALPVPATDVIRPEPSILRTAPWSAR